ncbi:MAG: NUDIX hydrolase [Gammaproteobacteria bacterium]|nr:NUDIX hydrolase [Gammaproteobacteria bacterium]
MNFCSNCGASVSLQVPEGDNRERHVCVACGIVHYVNPRIVAGCLPVWEDKVLLCRRAIEPRHGKWTLPAGFMELGETTQEAAARETLEEACARVEVRGIHCVANIPRINQVYVIFHARLLDLEFGPGVESLEVSLRGESEIPWAEMAFPAIAQALSLYFDDRRVGRQQTHLIDVAQRLPPPGLDGTVQWWR